MKRRPLLLAAPLLLCHGLFARAATAAEAPLPVVATISILADMTREIGGDAVRVTSLVGPDADPHAYQPRPGDLRALKIAALVVENGLGLEPWLPRLLRNAGFAGRLVVASAKVSPRTLNEGGKSVPDPHAWQDPRNGVLYVQAIADGLAAALPAEAASIRGRAEAYAGRIAALDGALATLFAEIPAERRRLVTSHDAFGYLAARYGIRVHGIQGLDNASELSARRMAALARTVREEGVRTIFLENMEDPRLARALARETGAAVGPRLYSDALSPPGGPAGTYLDLLRTNAGLIAAAMKGTVAPAAAAPAQAPTAPR
jgi:zinc/manganese transport system substrate-binding protein